MAQTRTTSYQDPLSSNRANIKSALLRGAGGLLRGFSALPANPFNNSTGALTIGHAPLTAQSILVSHPNNPDGFNRTIPYVVFDDNRVDTSPLAITTTSPYGCYLTRDGTLITEDASIEFLPQNTAARSRVAGNSFAFEVLYAQFSSNEEATGESDAVYRYQHAFSASNLSNSIIRTFLDNWTALFHGTSRDKSFLPLLETTGVIPLALYVRYNSGASIAAPASLIPLTRITEAIDFAALRSALKLQAGDLGDEQVATEHLQDGAVTTPKIASSVVATEHLQDGAVTTPKIASSSVTAEKIGDNEIRSNHIQNFSIFGNKITFSGVGTSQIAQGAITETRLGSGAVTNPKIANGAVTEEKIADGAVTEEKIADESVTAGKIADEAIQNNHLSDSSVERDQIRVGAIELRHLNNSFYADLVNNILSTINPQLSALWADKPALVNPLAGGEGSTASNSVISRSVLAMNPIVVAGATSSTVTPFPHLVSMQILLSAYTEITPIATPYYAPLNTLNAAIYARIQLPQPSWLQYRNWSMNFIATGGLGYRFSRTPFVRVLAQPEPITENTINRAMSGQFLGSTISFDVEAGGSALLALQNQTIYRGGVTTGQSTSSGNRLYRNWFGAEFAAIRQTEAGTASSLPTNHLSSPTLITLNFALANNPSTEGRHHTIQFAIRDSRNASGRRNAVVNGVTDIGSLTIDEEKVSAPALAITIVQLGRTF